MSRKPKFTIQSLSNLTALEFKLITELNYIQRRYDRDSNHVSISYGKTSTKRFFALQAIVSKGIALITGKRNNIAGYRFSKEFIRWQKR